MKSIISSSSSGMLSHFLIFERSAAMPLSSSTKDTDKLENGGLVAAEGLIVFCCSFIHIQSARHFLAQSLDALVEGGGGALRPGCEVEPRLFSELLRIVEDELDSSAALRGAEIGRASCRER